MVNNIILIDGGMGQELIHRSKVKPDGLWSARVMLDNYDLVVDLHRDFIKAGAEAITLNSYSICLLYTSPSPRDLAVSRMPSSA